MNVKRRVTLLNKFGLEGVFGFRRQSEMPALQIPQQTAEFAFSDFVPPVDQLLSWAINAARSGGCSRWATVVIAFTCVSVRRIMDDPHCERTRRM
jgi:hypothetical protein